MTQANSVSISSLPAPLHWHGVPQSWELTGKNVLSITAGQRSDWFIDPGGTANVRNAPALLFKAAEVCQFSAQVTANAAAKFDAGVLVAYHADTLWGKLCLEMNPQGQLSIVSVVTKGVSDDCNSVPVDGNSIYLRIAKFEQAYAFHYSHDAKTWNLVRYFSLGATQDAEIGFIAQSPVGDGCSASFSEIVYLPEKLNDIRSGE